MGRLALSLDDSPDMFPINFIVDHGSIVFRTGQGSKLSTILANPQVAFEVDGYDPDGPEAWSVVIKGRAAEVKNLHAWIQCAELPLFPWHGAPKGHFIRIEPQSTTGRQFSVVDSAAWDTPAKGARPAAAE